MGCVYSSQRAGLERRDEAPSFAHLIVAADGSGFSSAPTGRSARLLTSSLKRFGCRRAGLLRARSVPEMSSILGRAGVLGLEKAVEVLDTLGSSMTNMSAGSRFLPGMLHRGNKISILAFEVANTITKGAALMESLSRENVQLLENEILQSEGVKHLVATNGNQLLAIAAADKRDELDVFCREVVRFGDLCKNPQWHNLSRYFEKLDLDTTPQPELKKEAEATMQHLVTLADHTAELYHELHALDRLELDYRRKVKEEETLPTGRRGEGLMSLHGELKQQRKLVESLKKKTLWSRNLEEVVEKLVDIITSIYKEFLEAFGQAGINAINAKPDQSPRRLGVLGLSLHYANIINLIDNAVSLNSIQLFCMALFLQDAIYHGLPASVKAALRPRLQSFHVNEELSFVQIKATMQKILQWLVPMAENTTKAHQGFGWVGEWASMSTEFNKKSAQQSNVIRILSLYHADKEKTDEFILQLAVWLHHLAVQVKARGFGSKTLSSVHHHGQKYIPSSLETKKGLPLSPNDKSSTLSPLSEEDRRMLEGLGSRRAVLRRSKSHGCTDEKVRKGRRTRSLSYGNSPNKEFSSALDVHVDRTRVLDVIDGLHGVDPPIPIDPFYL
ncbi:unnamed protein product [Spirodela intermedia]|uniref:Uncharacterized protein n=1 Tax=Spirodela intermedia TaxID=51605 RepID=A0A7I8JA98_SPIIN|nr:unnamed protein product [Spirodela intermedia]CAA6666695.1 unnamed protein product [Spirodela intermedia]